MSQKSQAKSPASVSAPKQTLEPLDTREKPGGRPGIQWDEETIKEHDKDRGTRQVIDEPKTPFVKEDPQLKDVDLVAALTKRVEEREEQEEKEAAFSDKRKQHYNMGAGLKEAMELARKAMEEEEEDEDEEEPPAGSGSAGSSAKPGSAGSSAKPGQK